MRCADSDELDASLLLGVLLSYGDPKGGRWAGTIEAVRRELAHGPFVRRYTGEDGLDGLGGRVPGLLVLARRGARPHRAGRGRRSR